MGPLPFISGGDAGVASLVERLGTSSLVFTPADTPGIKKG